MIITHRTCLHCKIEKHRDQFDFGDYPGDLSSICKPCRKAYGHAHRAAKTAARKAAIRAIAEPCTKCMETGKLRIGRPTAPGVYTCTHHLIAALKKGEEIGYIDGIK